MKITKRQLRRIIKEERAKLNEVSMAEVEMELTNEIVDLLIERAAINSSGDPGFDGAVHDIDTYQDALDYVRDAIVPALKELAGAAAWERK